MNEVFASPQAAAQGDTPARFTEVIAVKYSPGRDRALVFLELNEPPHTEPYEVLCVRDRYGWRAPIGSSGGGEGWKWTHDDPERGPLGVASSWRPPTARWDVPASEGPSRRR